MLASALLGESPPELPVRRLVRVAALYGINENQARVALSRMAHRGEVAVHDGTVALTGPLLARSARLAEARRAPGADFDGTWHLVVVTASGDGPATRRERRGALRRARLGELRDGVWVRPANLPLVLEARLAAAVTCFTSRPERPDRELAAEVFDLAGWARRARELAGRLAIAERVEAPLAAGFELDAEVLRHLQRDPLLPTSLLDRDWPGTELRARYTSFHAAYRAALADAHRELVAAGR